jgi:DNA-binding response OmpR family regulator
MTQSAIHAILVIEDDGATLEFLELFLSTHGYQVHTAATGERGLALVAAHPVEVVLLDRRLPDMDGVTVCAHLRERMGPIVSIIMLTADRDPALEATARAAGATTFLRKPFDPGTLLQRLSSVLNT